jgi:hypothetical protein
MTPSPTPTLSASNPSFAAPTSSPSASSTANGSPLVAVAAWPADTVISFTAVPPSIFAGSPRTLPSGADAAGGTAVKFYELRDNLHHHGDAPAMPSRCRICDQASEPASPVMELGVHSSRLDDTRSAEPRA